VAPGFGGIEEIAAHLHEVTFLDASGQSLAATRVGEVGWSVTHPPSVEIVARWWLGEPQPAASGTGNDYRPYVDGERFHFLGSAGLLRYDPLAGRERHRFALEFRGCDAPDRAAACSFGSGPRLIIEESLDAFCHAVFTGGAVRLLRRDLAGRELLLAIFGVHDFADDQLADLAAEIMRLERAFFADPGEPLYFIAALPEPSKPPGTSIGGTGLTRSFALFLGRGFPLAAGSDTRLRVSSLLVHELFHHWNGLLVRGRDDPEGLSYWFSEGFTEFFTRRLLVRSGIASVRQWLDEWNRCFESFARSPAKEAPAERIVAEFWTDRAVSELPYLRGAIVAALLDREIRASTSGAQSLDDFMRERVVAARDGEHADTAVLLERIADWTSAEFSDQVRTIVLEGALPPLHEAEDLFGPLFRLRLAPDPGSGAGAMVPRLELLPGTREAEARAGL
jgi:predicted metalloprotease with PDZ domain